MRAHIAFALLAAAPALAEEAHIPTLEELVNVNITSLSKKDQNAYTTSAAVYVITAEDIRRTGVTSIAEALRLAPGVHVARAGSSGWAVSGRGFNGEFANKMLVLMDGRSVYSPIFGGVYWNEQQRFLDNIERIEVIRGPAGAIWGANATNGVINIITKEAKDTQGGLTQGRFGNREAGAGTRYGGKVGEKSHYRASISHDDFGESLSRSGKGMHDDWDYTQAEFRSDLTLNDRDSMTVQGDYYSGDTEEDRTLPTPFAPYSFDYHSGTSIESGNVNLGWKRKLAQGSEISLRGYYDENHRTRDIAGEHRVRTFDAEFQHHLPIGARHDVNWGAGYRLVSDRLEGSEFFYFNDPDASYDTFNAFVQDEIDLYNKEVLLTLGSKFEHNDFSGFEVQPNARVSWLMSEDTTWWTSISRAVRSPNRASEDVRLALTAQPQGVLTFVGQEADKPESLIAYEAGVRSRLSRDVVVDATVFYNDYDRLLLNEAGQPYSNTLDPWGTYTVLPLSPGVTGEGRAYGTEVAAYWDVTDRWKLRGAYSYFNADLDVSNTAITNRENSVPYHQFNLRSYWDIDDTHQFDTMLYYNGAAGAGVDEYLRADIRLGWSPTERFDFSIIGQNLLDARHQEYTPFTYNTPAEIGRAVYGRATWRF